MFGADGDVGGIVDSYEAREFRLKELLRAQKLSAGPCFMVSQEFQLLKRLRHINYL